MKVKICGIRTFAEAEAAIVAGADMLGYNFYKHSKRYIEPQSCRDLQQNLAMAGYSVTSVAVFVNEAADSMRQILANCRIDYAQLSGDETAEFAQTLPFTWFRSIRPENRSQAIRQAEEFARPAAEARAPQLLVDAYRPGAYGGTGHTADWTMAAQLASSGRTLLAGGLRPENVAAAIQQVQPWGVDVASGVEGPDGFKDTQKISAFISASRGTDD